MSDHMIVQLEEVEEQTDGRQPWRPVAARLGITSFGANTWTARDAGDRILNEHDESEPGSDEELYVVMRGRATFELGGERHDAPAGALVFVRPGVKRTAFAEEAGTTILALGAVPGQAYEPSVWSIWAPLQADFEAGKYDEVIERAHTLLEAQPDSPGLLFNIACCESLAGRTDDALEHLRRSIELSERSRLMAKEDSDFDPIRSEPRFKELVGA